MSAISRPQMTLVRQAVSWRNGANTIRGASVALQLTRRGHCGLDNRYGAEVDRGASPKVAIRAFGLVLNVDGYPLGRAQKPCQGRFARLQQLG